MRKGRIVMVLSVVALVAFMATACAVGKHGGNSDTAGDSAVDKAAPDEKGTAVGQEGPKQEVGQESPVQESPKPEGETNPTGQGGKEEDDSAYGLEIKGFTDELGRILDTDVGTVAKEWRAWLDKNGHSGITAVAICDSVQVTLSEQKFSVQCELVPGTQGNGMQPDGAGNILAVMDYYKNRGMFQFHTE